jgi:hypothetical protein
VLVALSWVAAAGASAALIVLAGGVAGTMLTGGR